MLEFFRRHQRIFFLAITVVIVISFVFFGTYKAATSHESQDSVAFVAIDGTPIYTSEFHDVIRLLSSDAKENLFSMNQQGSGFNTGFVSEKILEPGVAEVIIAPYLNTLRQDFNSRTEREKYYSAYVNPEVPFLSAEQVWTYFAPNVKKWFDKLRSQSEGATPEALTARIQLYLAERNFPASYLKQMLKYQEQQQEWIVPDQELPYRDLALFGYHSLQDWFGSSFIELIAKYVINAAKIAEEHGYKLSQEEVLQELSSNLQQSFKENRSNPYFAIENLQQYFQEELRKLGMDRSRLVHAWRYIMLYKTLFEDNNDNILVSDVGYKAFMRSMNEFVDVEIYRLAKEFNFQNLRDIEKFEVYLNAIRDPREIKHRNADSLMLPQKFLLPQEVQKVYPSLVQKRYRLRYTMASEDEVESKIGVRKTWEWEIQDKNWKKLVANFPELATGNATTPEERITILDDLDNKTRTTIDTYSREIMLVEHPELLTEALLKAQPKDEVLFLRVEDGPMPFQGMKNQTDFLRLLDNAPLGELSPALSRYGQDGDHVYCITVLEREDNLEIMTYKDALSDGTLDKLLDKALETTYQKYRLQKPSQFVDENGEWKPFLEVRDQIASYYFEDFFRRLNTECEQAEKTMPHFTKWEEKEKARIACRLLPYMKKVWQQIKEQPNTLEEWILDPKKVGNEALSEQWKLINKQEKLTRRDATFPVEPLEVLSLRPDIYSKLRFMNNSGIAFFKVLDKGVAPFDDQVHQKVFEARELLGRDLQRELARILLRRMQEKDAL